MNIRKLSDKKPKILLFQGSPRKIDSCANQKSKSERVIEYILDKWMPFVNFEVIDLGISDVRIQPCKGCVSTANGMHCHWFCSCFSKGMKENPDLMYEADIYTKLEECDGFIVVSPVHWYAVSSQVKAMFDRLVCANLTITKEQAREIFGKGNTKNSELTGRAELSGKYKHLLKNHLEGKWAGFIVHGDNGANDYGNNPPDIGDQFWSVRNNVMPLVYQCRFSGIHCPDDLVEAIYMNEGMPYYQANLSPLDQLFELSDGVVERMIDYINNF
jgi:multimeric flavodoxin WrbA